MRNPKCHGHLKKCLSTSAKHLHYNIAQVLGGRLSCIANKGPEQYMYVMHGIAAQSGSTCTSCMEHHNCYVVVAGLYQNPPVSVQ